MDSVITLAQANEQNQIAVRADTPWLQMNGEVTPDDHLKTLTPQWSPETWGKYLSWFESLTGQRAESMVSPRRYDEVCETQEESIFAFAQSNADDDLRSLVADYLEALTDQQRRVVELIFWEGRSERQVSEELGINHGSVHRLKLRAISKIKGLLMGGCSSRIMRGETSPLINERGTDEGIHCLAEVDLAEAGWQG